MKMQGKNAGAGQEGAKSDIPQGASTVQNEHQKQKDATVPATDVPTSRNFHVSVLTRLLKAGNEVPVISTAQLAVIWSRAQRLSEGQEQLPSQESDTGVSTNPAPDNSPPHDHSAMHPILLDAEKNLRQVIAVNCMMNREIVRVIDNLIMLRSDDEIRILYERFKDCATINLSDFIKEMSAMARATRGSLPWPLPGKRSGAPVTKRRRRRRVGV